MQSSLMHRSCPPARQQLSKTASGRVCSQPALALYKPHACRKDVVSFFLTRPGECGVAGVASAGRDRRRPIRARRNSLTNYIRNSFINSFTASAWTCTSQFTN
jgi:hypothetical protein